MRPFIVDEFADGGDSQLPNNENIMVDGIAPDVQDGCSDTCGI